MIAGLDDLSLRDLIDKRASDAPEALFLTDPTTGETVTFEQLRDACQAVAQRVAREDIPTGSAIGYAMNNGAEAAKIILGLLYGGYLATAINLVSGQNTIDYVLEHSESRLVFCQSGTKSLLANSAEEVAVVEVDSKLFEAAADGLNGHAPKPETEGLLMYTSGTTGVPKGVVLTHANLLAGGVNTTIAHQLDRSDCGLCVLPLYHINGLCVTLLGALASGSGLIMPNRFSVSRFWDYLREHGGTWFSVVPTQISYLLNETVTVPHDRTGLAQLRFGRSASAPLSPDVQQAFEREFGIPIIETMGLTETAAQILSNPVDGLRIIGSPGIAYGNEVIIADEAQHPLPEGQEGELLVRGPNVMKGYLKNPQATAAALTEYGWLRTGDLGRMDGQGYVTITGRLKELIIKGGENIAPREVDDALYSHPDVIEAAAFGRPCDQYGQRVEAGVKLREGSHLSPQELIQICQSKIGAFKSPDQIHLLSELPKGPSGKIQRAKLPDLTV
ncbi:MAG: AMP-binding protein [Rhizobiaceae bacterium]